MKLTFVHLIIMIVFIKYFTYLKGFTPMWKIKFVAGCSYYDLQGIDWTGKYGGENRTWGRVVKNESTYRGFVNDGARNNVMLYDRETLQEAQKDVEIILEHLYKRLSTDRISRSFTHLRDELLTETL